MENLFVSIKKQNPILKALSYKNDDPVLIIIKIMLKIVKTQTFSKIVKNSTKIIEFY